MVRAGRFLLALFCALAATPTPAAEPGLAVIVHHERSDKLTLQQLSEIYRKQRRFWNDGKPIVPLNREPGSPAREAFSRRVFGGPSEKLAAYWNEQYFQGIFPPVTLSSDAAVRRYVAVDRNAIGYILIDAVDDTVRVALRLD